MSCSSLKSTFGLTQHDRVYPLYQTCLLKNGLWGDWERHFSYFSVQTEYNKVGLNIYLYAKGEHPSNYMIKIMIDKYSRSNEGYGLYSSYQGEVIVSEINILDYTEINDKGRHKCTILCDKDMDKAIQKNGLVGTLNILYGNGFGRGFNFWDDSNY